MAFNPHYEGAMNRQRQLEALRGQVMGRVNASPGETMRRMRDTAPNALQSALTSQVSLGNSMQQREMQDRVRAGQARLQYRRNRARYLLGG